METRRFFTSLAEGLPFFGDLPGVRSMLIFLVAIILVILLVLRMHNRMPSQFDILLQGIFSSRGPKTNGRRRSLAGKVCLITGASSGLGLATAKKLASMGVAKVILACLPSTITPELKADIEKERNKDAQTEVKVVALDLGDFESIEKCCTELDDTLTQPIDVVILNAGVAPPRTVLTKQGLELAFGVNYVGHFLFTMRLLQKGLIANKSFCQVDCKPEEERVIDGDSSSDQPRIIMIASESHRGAKPLSSQTLGTVPKSSLFNSMSIYSHSKLCVTTWCLELARRLDGEVKVLALCPGPMNTQLASGAPLLIKPFVWLMFNLFFSDPSKAAKYVTNLARLEDFSKPTGIYCFRKAETEPSKEAQDEEAAKMLWSETIEIIRQHGGPDLTQ